ncbi:MAG: hypothetical protein LIP23_08135 [Planctomycetes bacterium]|nr:hypothetical protein [Planctomycetota bacterium]
MITSISKIKLALVAACMITVVACQAVKAEDSLRDPIRESYVIDNRFTDSGAYGISAYSDDNTGYAVPSRSYSTRYVAPTYAAPYSSTYTPLYTMPSYSSTYVAPRSTTYVAPRAVTAPSADYSVYGNNAVHVRGPIAESYTEENRFVRPPVTAPSSNMPISSTTTRTTTYSAGSSSGSELRDPIQESVVNENRFVNY